MSKNKNIILNNSIYEFFIFSKNGICISHSQYKKIYDNENDYERFKKSIKNISCNLLNKATDTSLFNFCKIRISNLIIQILLKDEMSFIGIFPINSSHYFHKLILIHMYIALLNFKGDTIEKVRIINKKKMQKKSFETLQTFFYKFENELEEFKMTDLFELMIYELYFLRYIGIHFQKIFNELLKREEFNESSYFKFKNLYIVDLSTGNILLDWLDIEKNKQNIKYYLNDKLWFELMHHSKMMMEDYKNEHKFYFTYIGSSFRFVKFECTSTFPRLTFIIKFIPLLKGLSIIHIYSQKKLSRITENSDQQLFRYKEIDLLYGADIRTNSNLDFRYSEHRILQYIEKFFIEFFISIRNSEIFRDQNTNKELKYFNYPIILEINRISENSNCSVNEIIEKINKGLKEMYYNNNNSNDKGYNRAASIYSRIFTDAEKLDNVLVVKKEDILKDLFDRDNKNTKEKKKNSNNIKKKKNVVVLVRNHFLNNQQKKVNENKSNSISFSDSDEISQNEKVTINQSISISKISNKLIKSNSNNNININDEDKRSKEILLDKLIDMSESGKIYIDDINTDRNLNNNKLFNIKVPKPKIDDNENKEKKMEKLILIDDIDSNSQIV